MKTAGILIICMMMHTGCSKESPLEADASMAAPGRDESSPQNPPLPRVESILPLE